MKAEIKITGKMDYYYETQKFHILGQATKALSELRKVLKSNKVPYEYIRNESIKISGGRAYVRKLN